MERVKIFSSRLKDLMLDAETTPELLSTELHHNLYDFYHWTSGNPKCLPSLQNAVMLADRFRCSVGYLVGETEENDLPNPKPAPPFPERFSEVVKTGEIKLYKLARSAGISSTTVFYDWMHGKKEPRIETLLSVARALDRTIDDLLGRE